MPQHLGLAATEALLRLQAFAQASAVNLPAAQPHHLRGWVAQLRVRGLAARSIAIHLAAWRGLYRHLGREGVVPINPVGPRLHQPAA